MCRKYQNFFTKLLLILHSLNFLNINIIIVSKIIKKNYFVVLYHIVQRDIFDISKKERRRLRTAVDVSKDIGKKPPAVR